MVYDFLDSEFRLWNHNMARRYTPENEKAHSMHLLGVQTGGRKDEKDPQQRD
jgi:hypothetical protein